MTISDLRNLIEDKADECISLVDKVSLARGSDESGINEDLATEAFFDARSQLRELLDLMEDLFMEANDDYYQS